MWDLTFSIPWADAFSGHEHAWSFSIGGGLHVRVSSKAGKVKIDCQGEF